MFLVADGPFDDLNGALVQLEVIDLAFAGDHRLAETEVGVDDQVVDPAGNRVDRETDAGHVAVNLPLDHGGHARLALGEPLPMPIKHRPVPPKRDEAVTDSLAKTVDAAHVQVSVMLAREG